MAVVTKFDREEILEEQAASEGIINTSNQPAAVVEENKPQMESSDLLSQTSRNKRNDSVSSN